MRKLFTAAMVGLMTLVLVAPAFAGGAMTDRVYGPFDIFVPTGSGENFGLMWAECDFVQRVEYPDGTAMETERCRLTVPLSVGDPDAPPFLDGSIPDRTYKESGGDCTWASEYWGFSVGDLVIADSYTIICDAGQAHTPEFPTARDLAASTWSLLARLEVPGQHLSRESREKLNTS